MPGIPPRVPSGNGNQAKFQQWLYNQQTRESRVGHVSGTRVINSTSGKLIVPSRSRGGGSGASVFTFILLYAEANHLVCRDVTLETLGSGKVKVSTIGSTDIYVAKPPELRCFDTTLPGWAGLAWDSMVITHAFDTSEPYMVFTSAIVFPDADTRPALTTEQTDEGWNEWNEAADDYGGGGSRNSLRLNYIRTVTLDGVTENQRVIPVWRKGELIYAQELETPEVTAVGQLTDAGQSIDYIMVSDGRQWARF
jgi:hypothetical protein